MVAFRVDDAQLAIIQQAAAATQRKVADYCRLVVLQHAAELAKGDAAPLFTTTVRAKRRRPRSASSTASESM